MKEVGVFTWRMPYGLTAPFQEVPQDSHLIPLYTSPTPSHLLKLPSPLPEYQPLMTSNGIQCHARIGPCWTSRPWMKKAEVERRTTLYHRTVAQAYNRTIKPRAFKQGDLMLKVVEHVRRQMSGPSKFAPQWEGAFAVKEVYISGYYRLVSVKEGTLTDPINGKWLKPYYY
ncbi:hypothetical protein L3X38_037286 [Prunus dulcis]|uniref:Uncharacterized protein n=1 Tax=Prunus dulcis TaxID=3755 RepID=A0AAD4V336_PRUDU|nr:hypothetical protein L3X38_037286 [Prunus dulcis]